MTDDNPSGTYSVHLSGELAKEIESDADKRDISKSKAMRDLLVDGQKYRHERARFFYQSINYMTGVALAGVFTLLISAFLLGLAIQLGGSLGISPWYPLVAATILVLVAGLGYFFRLTGLDDYLDDKLNRLERFLGLAP